MKSTSRDELWRGAGPTVRALSRGACGGALAVVLSVRVASAEPPGVPGGPPLPPSAPPAVAPPPLSDGFPPPPAGPLPPLGPPGTPPLVGSPAAWTLPVQFPYREGEPLPTGYHLEERHKLTMPFVGGLLLLASYGLCAGLAGGGQPHAEYGYIPLAGSFIAAVTVDASLPGDTTRASFILTGIGQIMGGAVLAYGLLATETWAVRNRTRIGWMVAPMVLGTRQGASLLLHF